MTKVLEFAYQGGSNPGSTRFLYNYIKDSYYVRGYDLVKEEPRNFKTNLMQNTTEHDAIVIDVSQLSNNAIKVLQSQLVSEGNSVFITDSDLIAFKRETQTSKLQSNGSISFIKGNKVLKTLSIDKYFGKLRVDNSIVETLEDLKKALN